MLLKDNAVLDFLSWCLGPKKGGGPLVHLLDIPHVLGVSSRLSVLGNHPWQLSWSSGSGLVPLPFHSTQLTKLPGQASETELKWALAFTTLSAIWISPPAFRRHRDWVSKAATSVISTESRDWDGLSRGVFACSHGPLSSPPSCHVSGRTSGPGCVSPFLTSVSSLSAQKPVTNRKYDLKLVEC